MSIMFVDGAEAPSSTNIMHMVLPYAPGFTLWNKKQMTHHVLFPLEELARLGVREPRAVRPLKKVSAGLIMMSHAMCLVDGDVR